MITTSEIKISVLVDRDSSLPAPRAVHQVYELEQEPSAVPPRTSRRPATAARPVNGPDLGNLVERLQGIDMEELFISDLSLDQSQALVTIVGVPNQPGVAAGCFRALPMRASSWT